MLSSVYMPAWAWCYLVFCVLLFAVGATADKLRSRNHLISSALSLFCICLCVTGFFNENIQNLFGYSIIPLVCMGIFWEFSRAVRETKLAEEELENEGDLSEKERSILLTLAIGFNGIVVVPGYVAGILLSFRIIGLM